MAAVSGQLVLYGSYSSSMNPSVCVEAVEKMGKERCSHDKHILPDVISGERSRAVQTSVEKNIINMNSVGPGNK